MNTIKTFFGMLSGTLLLCAAVFTSQAQAATVQLNFTDVYSGTAPTGLTATIEDTTANTVKVTLSAGSPIVNEFVGQVYLNLDPALDASNLVYSFVSASQGVALKKAITLGTDCCKAGGGGKYDIFLDFKTNSAAKFGANETFVFTLSLSGLSANSFAFTTLDGGDKGNYYGAAHIQNTGTRGGDSGWIGATDGSVPPVPVPASVWLLGSGLIGLVGVARRTPKA